MSYLSIPSGWTLQEIRDCLEKTKQTMLETDNRSHKWYVLAQQQSSLEHLINLIETSE